MLKNKTFVIALASLAISATTHTITQYDAEYTARKRFDSLFNYHNQSYDAKTTLTVWAKETCNYNWATYHVLNQMDKYSVIAKTDSGIIDAIRREVGDYARNIKRTSDAVAQEAAKIVADSAKTQTFDSGLYNFVGKSLMVQSDKAIEKAKQCELCLVVHAHIPGGPAIYEEQKPQPEEPKANDFWLFVGIASLAKYFSGK